MNPTRTLESADFSLHRVVFSSRQRVLRTYSTSTNFRVNLDIPGNAQIFRFAVRRVTFPNVSSPWDLNNAPYIYYRLTKGGNVNIYRARLDKLWTLRSHVAPDSPDNGAGASTLQGLMRSGTLVTIVSGVAITEVNDILVYFNGNSTVTNQLTFNFHTSGHGTVLDILGIREAEAGGDQLVSHYGNSIIGVPTTLSGIAHGAPKTAPFPYNISGLMHVYLCSTVLTATARSMRPQFAPVENCVLAIPRGSTYLNIVDYQPEQPTVWNCNQDNNWDEVDFQLRYDTGGLVDLGENDLEIEVEFEVMEQFNPPPQQMKEAVYVPFVNVHDTTKLLLKRDNRSWGSYGGTAGTRQFSAAGYTSRVFR